MKLLELNERGYQMYRKVDDFIQEWENASNGTLRALEAYTDEKLDQKITEGHNSLRWLGWHLATAPLYFAGQLGLDLKGPENPSKVPETANEIVTAYRTVSNELKEAVQKTYTDEDLTENIDMHGTPTPRGAVLRTIIDHQTHHRGQITVLLRQAGLKVPGVMGPTKEEQAK
jgi:uncharacterized damage-inducible protein DinB